MKFVSLDDLYELETGDHGEIIGHIDSLKVYEFDINEPDYIEVSAWVRDLCNSYPRDESCNKCPLSIDSANCMFVNNCFEQVKEQYLLHKEGKILEQNSKISKQG
jgi:hypothetical protein